MTLVNGYVVGGATCVLTCDTRQTMNLFGKTMLFKNKENKIARISDNIIACGGGYEVITDFIHDELIKSSPRNRMDCYIKLRLLASEVRTKFASILKHDEIFAQFVVLGFNPDSNENWYVRYVLGEDIEVTYSLMREKEVEGVTFAPSYDNLEKVLEKIGGIKFNSVDVEGLTSDMVEYFSLLHKRLNEMEPETISEEFCYHAVSWNDELGKLVHYAGKLNLNEIEIA